VPGMKEMSLERAWKIFQKKGAYDEVHRKYALDRLVREIEAHMGGAVCPDMEIHRLNGAWYATWEGKMRPLDEVLSEIDGMKKPPGSVVRIRVSRPK